MKKEKKSKEVKIKVPVDKTKIIVRVVASLLAFLMVFSIVASVIFSIL